MAIFSSPFLAEKMLKRLLLLVVICHAAETSEHHLGAVLLLFFFLFSLVDTHKSYAVGTLHQQSNPANQAKTLFCFSLPNITTVHGPRLPFLRKKKKNDLQEKGPVSGWRSQFCFRRSRLFVNFNRTRERGLPTRVQRQGGTAVTERG